MTPLLGTKTPSAPVGAKSGGDRRAARSLLSCALWRGLGRLWRGMGGMGRPEPLSAHRPHQQQRLSGFHETRNTAFFAVGAQGTHNQKPPPGPPRTPPGRRFPARCGAAWGGYGAAWAAAVPRTGTRPVGFSPATGHATWLSPVPPAASRRATSSPTNGFSRNTRHGPFRISHEFPRFPTISRTPPTPPDVHVPVSISVGLAASAVRCRCRRPLGCFHRRERNRNPCSERRTFWIALTSRSAGAE